MSSQLVSRYLERLEAALGTAGFDAVYAEVGNLSREEVNEIASRFVARTAKSAAKRHSLQRIQAKHDGIVNLARKNEWQRGKGAA